MPDLVSENWMTICCMWTLTFASHSCLAKHEPKDVIANGLCFFFSVLAGTQMCCPEGSN